MIIKSRKATVYSGRSGSVPTHLTSLARRSNYSFCFTCISKWVPAHWEPCHLHGQLDCHENPWRLKNLGSSNDFRLVWMSVGDNGDGVRSERCDGRPKNKGFNGSLVWPRRAGTHGGSPGHCASCATLWLWWRGKKYRNTTGNSLWKIANILFIKYLLM